MVLMRLMVLNSTAMCAFEMTPVSLVWVWKSHPGIQPVHVPLTRSAAASGSLCAHGKLAPLSCAYYNNRSFGLYRLVVIGSRSKLHDDRVRLPGPDSRICVVRGRLGDGGVRHYVTQRTPPPSARPTG
jgi:hypothetical protein